MHRSSNSDEMTPGFFLIPLAIVLNILFSSFWENSRSSFLLNVGIGVFSGWKLRRVAAPRWAMLSLVFIFSIPALISMMRGSSIWELLQVWKIVIAFVDFMLQKPTYSSGIAYFLFCSGPVASISTVLTMAILQRWKPAEAREVEQVD